MKSEYEYIKRADIMKALTAADMQRTIKGADGAEAYRLFLDIVLSAPTADVAPVRHGKWVVEKCEGVSTIFACSNCSNEIKLRNAYFMKPTECAAEWYPYCRCGARMDADEDDERSRQPAGE